MKQRWLNYRKYDNVVVGFDMTNGDGWISFNMTTLWLDLIWKMKTAEFLLDMTNENGNGWIPIKHDTFLMKLTWNRNDWISVNMTRLWLDLMWKRHRLNFHMTAIVDGFALKNGNGWIFDTMTMLWLDLTWKTKMAEFLLDMTNVFYWWTWHENMLIFCFVLRAVMFEWTKYLSQFSLERFLFNPFFRWLCMLWDLWFFLPRGRGEGCFAKPWELGGGVHGRVYHNYYVWHRVKTVPDTTPTQWPLAVI